MTYPEPYLSYPCESSDAPLAYSTVSATEVRQHIFIFMDSISHWRCKYCGLLTHGKPTGNYVSIGAMADVKNRPV